MLKVCVIYENFHFLRVVEKIARKDLVINAISISEVTSNAESVLAELRTASWDYIVIGANDELSSVVIEFLIKYGQCSRERMVVFYRAYYCMLRIPKIQKVMSNPRYFDLKGLIMGLSHAETGIVSSMFPSVTCSIATGGQDIYYNLRSLEWCMEHHKNHLRDLEYVIIDMYDYSYFNVDTSRGKNAVNYYLYWDGYIWDGHHFNENKNFNINFQQLKDIIDSQAHGGLAAGEMELFQFIFPDALSLTDYHDYDDDFKVKNIMQVVTQEELDAYVIDSSVMTKEFTETWQENENAFEEILKILRKLNADMKIKIVLMPRCKCIEERMEKYDRMLAPKFFAVLHKMQQKYGFEIFDLKGLQEISSHREYYYDSEHLNRNGAEQFTKYFIENCMENYIPEIKKTKL